MICETCKVSLTGDEVLIVIHAMAGHKVALGYDEFIRSKQIMLADAGLDKIPELNPQLFGFQKDMVAWVLRKGRAALFCDCGLGKTPMQLEWAKHVPGPVLILAPLAVAQQTVREGQKFGIPIKYLREGGAFPAPKITITNYEMLEHFDPTLYNGIVLDESSILKSYDGAFRNQIIESFAKTPFRLACTATPAPNDYMELGNHSEFLGALTRTEMLSTFFVHDGGDTAKWRVKRHAAKDFWKWVCSWAVMMRKPSDLGYDDDGFILPPLMIEDIVIDVAKPTDGRLFALPAVTLQERQQARSATVDERAAKVAEIVAQRPNEPWLIWCNLNSESEAAAAVIPGAVQVAGSDSREYKEAAVTWFIGDKCICNDPLFRTKLAKCQGKEKPISSDTIDNTESNELLNRLAISYGTELAESDTCISITSIIQRNSLGEQLPSKSATTRLAEKSTHAIHPSVRLESKNRNRRDLRTRFAEPTRSCVPMDASKTSMSCSPDRNIAAPSASAAVTSIIASSSDSILTIARKRSDSVDSCALRATLDLGNSNTLLESSKEQPCICGHQSGRRVLVSKPSIFGYGLNLQCCAKVAFLGLSDSYEQFYQAVRRVYRFGQRKQVNCYIVTSSQEGAVTENIKRKEKDAAKMAEEMVNNMHELNQQEVRGVNTHDPQVIRRSVEEGDKWTMHLGDCVEAVKEMKTDSVHYSVFSPPFASLYTYSALPNDMGNCRTHAEFYEHFSYLTKELLRVTMPGRLLSFHCMNLPISKERDGYIGIADFRGDLIRIFQAAGFIYHSEVCIWKDPVTAMQRTKALGLLHKQIKKDSCMSRQGIADYLVTMRKHGDNPERVTHTQESFPVAVWQRYASPVWMDIDPSDTLQRKSAREDDDERHICPLQLEVIRRAIELWTNPGDEVFSPFAGIGSEGYVAIQAGRRFQGIELKESYFKQAVANLRIAHRAANHLFGETEAVTQP